MARNRKTRNVVSAPVADETVNAVPTSDFPGDTPTDTTTTETPDNPAIVCPVVESPALADGTGTVNPFDYTPETPATTETPSADAAATTETPTDAGVETVVSTPENKKFRPLHLADIKRNVAFDCVWRDGDKWLLRSVVYSDSATYAADVRAASPLITVIDHGITTGKSGPMKKIKHAWVRFQSPLTDGATLSYWVPTSNGKCHY